MHLLPHKSWNPYSQKNIDKVRKDEREHQQKQQEEKKRKLDYEQEARYERLKRQKVTHADSPNDVAALFGGTSSSENATPAAEEEHKHFNLFPELEAKEQASAVDAVKGVKRANPEHEAELKAKQERENRQLTTYLGQSSTEYTKLKPWYEGGTSEVSAAKLQRMERRKSEADPLSTMHKYLHAPVADTARPSRQQLAVVRAQLDSTRPRLARASDADTGPGRGDTGTQTDARAKDGQSSAADENRDSEADDTQRARHKRDKEKKDKHKKRDKKAKKKDKKRAEHEALVERLRRERVARENEERAQLQRLVAPTRGPRATDRGPAPVRVERGGERMREDY